MRDNRAKIMLLDTAIAALPTRPATAAIWQQRINARRYKFDIEASGRLGELIRDNLDLLVDNIEFARAPYPTTYFEFDARALWSKWRPEQPIVASSDMTVGYLVHHGSVLVLASGQRPDTYKARDLPDDLVCGMSFRVNRPQSVPFSKLVGIEDLERADQVKQAFVFGGQRVVQMQPGDPTGKLISLSKAEFRRRPWEVSLPALSGAWTLSQIAAHFDVMPAFNSGDGNDVREMCFLGGGDPMILIAGLLLLNQPSKYVGLTHVQRERSIWRGALKSFKEHHVVTLHLQKDQKVGDILHTTERASPIRHEVPGHWKNYNKSVGCNHHHADERQAWEPVGPERTESGDYKRYWCPLCLQRRTWTEHFDRGSGGFATKEYVVRK